MKISGDIPAGLMQELSKRLEDSGVLIENFEVDAKSGHVNITTNQDLSEEKVQSILNDADAYAKVKGYVIDLVNGTEIDNVVHNERGFISPAIGAYIVGGGSIAGVAHTTMSGAISGNLLAAAVVGIVALIVGVHLYAKGYFWE